jgi:hypothetical protein
VALDEAGRVHEHAARAARGIEDAPVKRLDDLHDQADDGRRREELAALLAFGRGELTEEVLVDETECIALEILRVAVDVAQQRGDGRAVERRVRPRQHTAQVRVVLLHEPHRVVEIDDARGVVVLRADRPPCRPLRLDSIARRGERRVGEAQEDQSQHGRAVLRRLETGVRAQLVGRVPEAPLELCEVSGHATRDLAFVLTITARDSYSCSTNSRTASSVTS